MTDQEFIVLSFLYDQTAPVKIDKFPLQISSKFTPGISSPNSLIHLLQIKMAHASKWVDVRNLSYSITNFGREELQEEAQKRKQIKDKEDRLEQKSDLETQALKLSVEDLVLKLADYQKVKDNARNSVIAAYISAGVALFALIISLKNC